MKRSTLLIPAILFAVLVAATFVVQQADDKAQRTKERLDTFYKLSAIQSRFENALGDKLNIMRGLKASVASNPDMTAQEFDTLTRSLAFGQTGVLAVILTRGNTIAHAYPTSSRLSLVGSSIHDGLSRVQTEVIENSIARRSMYLAGPVSLQNGTKGIVAATPVFLHKEGRIDAGPFWGTVTMIIAPEPLFLEAGLTEYPLLQKALKTPSTDGGWGVIFGEAAVFRNDPVIMNVLLPQGYWMLAAAPEGGWGPSPYRPFIIGSGLLLALLVSLVVWFSLHQMQARELAQEEYMHLVHQARSLILRLETDGTVAFINEYALSFYELEKNDVLGKPFAGALVPEVSVDGTNQVGKINLMLRDPASVPVHELQSVRKNGEIVWVSWANRPSYDNRGRLRDVLCVGTDMTRRRQMEEALRKSESKYRLLTENVTDVIWGLDANMRFTYISPSDRKLRGYEASEVLGRPLWDFIAPGSRPVLLNAVSALEKSIRNRLPPNKSLTLTLEMKCRNGSTVWVETRATVLYNEEGEMVGMQGVSRDISDMKRAEALRDDMERMARHDLKTPLGAVIGLPDEIIRMGNLDDRQTQMLGVIRKAGESMLQLINRSLDLYKMETGTYRIEPVQIDLLYLLDQISAEVRPLLRAKSISFGVNAPDGAQTFPFMGEETLMLSMLSNMIKNAIEASPEGGSVQVELFRNHAVTISVHNQGAVPQELHDTFFDKYAKGSGSKGSGLGTYSIRLIARTHGGDARLDTSLPGETVVTVTLPAS